MTDSLIDRSALLEDFENLIVMNGDINKKDAVRMIKDAPAIGCSEITEVDSIADAVRFGLINAEPFTTQEVIRVALAKLNGVLPVEHQPEPVSSIDKALENGAKILADFKPEGERDKLDEWQGCYALLFKQLNDAAQEIRRLTTPIEQPDDCRESFEKYAQHMDYDLAMRSIDPLYQDETTDVAWDAWQAAWKLMRESSDEAFQLKELLNIACPFVPRQLMTNDSEVTVYKRIREILTKPTSIEVALDLNKCPKCGGVADNGHDRCLPPNPYFCTKCTKLESKGGNGE